MGFGKIETIKKRIIIFSTIFYSSFVLLEPVFQTISLILLLVSLLVFNYNELRTRAYDINLIKYGIPFFSFYVLGLFSIIWSTDNSSFIKEIQPNLSYIIIVFISVFLFRYNLKNNRMYILVFSISVFIYELKWIDFFKPAIADYHSMAKSHFSINELYFKLKNVYWDINSSYFNHYTYSTYLANISTVLLASIVFKIKNKVVFLLVILLICANLIFVLILKSKINIAISLILIAYILFLALVKLRVNRLIRNGIFIVLAFFLLFKSFDSISFSEIKLFQEKNTLDEKLVVIDHMRYEQYRFSYSIFKSNKIFGVGLGDIQPILTDSFKKREDLMYWHGIQSLNTHSQYLHYLTTLGLVGFFLFMFFIINGLRLALVTKNEELFLIISIFALNCFFENILARVWGTFIINISLLLTLPRSIDLILASRKSNS
jgi:O-antigen ligase